MALHWIALLCFVQDVDLPYYIKSTPRPYFCEFNGLMYKGHVNEAGDFVPRPGFTPKPRKTVRTTGAIRYLRAGGPKEPVYEYRSGRLIPGILDNEVLIPDLDGKIIDFKTYPWSPTARRI